MTLPKTWTDENNLKEGDRILVRANGHLEIRIKNDKNIERMNKEVLSVRNQLNHITNIQNHLIHATRTDEDQTGDKAKALVGQKDKNSGQ